MFRTRAEAIMRIDDIDDATDDLDETDGQRCRHRHDDADRGRTASLDDKAGALVHPPMPERVPGALEDLVSSSERA